MIKPLFVAALLSMGVAAAAPAIQLAQAQTAKPANAKSEFARMAASGDMFEIESSKLALGKSDDAAVKKFAQMLIDDHTAASKKLMSMSDEKPPAAMDKKHMDMLEKLRSADGKQFTQLFVSMQLQAHKEAVDLFESYSKNGDDAKLKSFASETLPRLRAHLQEAQKLQKS